MGQHQGGTLKIFKKINNGSNFNDYLKNADSIASNFTLTTLQRWNKRSGSKEQTVQDAYRFVSTTSSIAGASDTDISSASSGQILVHDGSDSFDNVSVSGDATLAPLVH